MVTAARWWLEWEFWAVLLLTCLIYGLRLGEVPPEYEYEEYPRGRVMHHPSSSEFMILADECILDHKDLIAQIKGALHLPAKTKIGSDPHYRCFACLYGKDEDDEE